MTIKLLNNKLSGVLFDLDNTLVSCTMNFNEMRRAVGCPEGVDILVHVSALDEDLRQQAHETIIDIEVADAQLSEPFDGLTELFEFLNHQDIPTGIITRNCLEAARLKLQRANLSTDILITREDFPAKPHPGALLHVANSWNLNTRNMLFVGDYKYDLLAANNAQMPSCLVHNEKDSPFTSMASYVTEDLITLKQDLKPFIQRNRLDL